MIKEVLSKGRQRGVMLVLLLMMAVAALAVPAKPGLTRTLTLADGTTVNAVLVGDEHGHFWRGADGKSYQSVAGTDYYQAVNSQNIIQKAQQRRTQANQRRTKRLAPRKVGNVGGIIGDKKGIIILVNFKDKSFTATQSDFNKLANQVNYKSGNYKGSMYDYFYAQSEGQFRLTFDVVGPYTVSQNCSYYGGNDSNDNDKYPAKMVIEALQLANDDVDFSDYDWDNDGEVDQVYVVYAGKGEADGGSDDTIWPHEWQLSSAKQYGDGSGAQTLDGVKIDTYACGGEQNGQTGATAGIGTMCHEFSHCLGYPDFYDTDYSGGQGMGYWDLMDGGSYNDDGYQPAGYTSYERWVAGWKEPIELVNTQTISNMAALQTTGSNTYVIYNKGNRNEYYLLENRQKTGWDASLPGAGLLILHVDYDATVWSNNEPNDDPSHQRMTWIAADNNYQYTTQNNTKYYTFSGMANDPFPYGSVNAFGKNTTPAATLYNKNSDNTYYLDSSVENITQNSNGTISFNFVGISNVATPTFSPAAGKYADAQTVTISCETAGATIYYTLDGTTPTTSSSVYSSALTISETTTVKAIAMKDGDLSAVATAKYTIGTSTINPSTTTFRLVSTTDDLEPGLRYIIACGSKSMAAGALSSSYLTNVQVNVSSDVITITDNVAVFILEETNNGWTFQNESTNQYLQSTAAKSVSYSSSAYAWTLSTGTVGVVMTAGDYGTMLYNSSSPRFTTYTSTPSTSMIQANLYVEDGSSTPVVAEPLIVADETMTFNTTVGTPQTKTFEVLSEGLTEDITVTLSGTNSNLFTLGSSTISRTASELGTTGSVTFTPTAAGTFTATVTLTSAGADPVTISLTGTATASSTPVVTGNEFALVTSASDFVEGDYIIVYEGAAMNTTVTSNRLQYTEITATNNVITTDNAAIIWHIAPSGNYYTIYNAGESKYAAATSSNNQAQLLTSGTDDKALWSVTTGATFDFVNKSNSRYLRRNSNYGFACYASGTGGALSLYKRTSGTTPTPITVEAPTISGTTPFARSTEVTITAESGASIYYTLDGTTPSESSTKYSTPFTLTATTTIKAIAVVNSTSSDVTSKKLTAYYESAGGKQKSTLKTAMCGIIYNRTEQSYDDLWTAYQTTDVRSDGKIWDMYSNITNYDPVNGSHANSAEGSGFNREHSFPKSWFGGEVMPMFTDLHHLYPVDGNINTRRSNNPYGETNGEDWKSANDFSKLGNCTYPGYTGKVFEPADEYKGDFARTYFYMVTCYEEKLHDWYTNYSSTDVVHVIDGNTYPGLQTWQLNMLMKWAKNDPVSEKETARNNAVYAIQNNRNPFIDYPGLEEYVWGTMTTTAFSYDNYVQPVYKQDVTMSFSPSTATATVGEDFTEPTLTTTPSGLTVTYSSSNTDAATVNASTGAVTLVAAGTTTITATFAGNDSYNSSSATYTLTVNAAPILPSVPTDLALSDVTSSSMTATWTAANNATSYELDVVQGSSFESSAGEAVLQSNFSSTTGWTLSGTGTYTGAGYYGIASPSIKFDGNGDYAISPSFSSGAKLQFWAYGNNGSGSTFQISGLVNSTWTIIETVTIASGGATYQVNLPAGTSQVRFDFTKSVNCALDDVVVYGPGNSPESVDGYPKSVGNITSYEVTSLTSETQYAVRVRAVNDAGNSDWSSAVTATTTVANSAPVWSAFPNASTTLGGADIELTISDYVSGTPTPTITLATSTANSADYDFDGNDGYFTFTPSATGTFTFTFTATNSEGSANATLTVTVNPAPVTVPTLAVTEADITSTTAPVSWDACDGVSSYTLQLASDDQFTAGSSGGGNIVELVNEGFDDGLTLPDGWTVVSGSIGGTYTSSGNYGSSSPSLKFSSTMTLSSPTISNPTDISFWYKGNGNSLTSTLVVEQLVSGSWSEVGSAIISGSASTFSHALNPAATQVRFVFTKASGNVAFDDVVINGTSSSSDSGSLIAEYTVNGTSYTFNGLTSGTTYYARVKGDSDWSNIVTFTTNSTLELANNSNNSSAIATAATNGGKYDVTLSGRTLYKDGAWNTLCLPFDLTNFTGTPLEGATVMTLGNSGGCNTGFDSTTGTLTLDFVEANSIEAGHAYIVKWTTTGNPIENPVFTGVTIENEAPANQNIVSQDGSVTFIGSYDPKPFTAGDKSILFLGSSNTLYYPSTSISMGAFRAYFQLNNGLTAGGASSLVKGFVLNFGEDSADGLSEYSEYSEYSENSDAWYDLSGRKLDGKPSKGGIYIHNGKKVLK